MTRRRKRFRFRALYFITKNWFIILIIGGLIITSLLMYNAAQAADKYPLYAKETEEQKLQDPVYRHKQLIKQLLMIECAIYQNAYSYYPNDKRKKMMICIEALTGEIK